MQSFNKHGNDFDKSKQDEVSFFVCCIPRSSLFHKRLESPNSKILESAYHTSKTKFLRLIIIQLVEHYRLLLRGKTPNKVLYEIL